MSKDRLSILAVTLAIGLGIAGCTPTASGSTPPATVGPSATAPSSPTPSPTSTWSPEQAAAIAAVNGYSATTLRIGANPSKFNEAEMTAEFKKYLGPNMLTANVTSLMHLRRNGWHQAGEVAVLSLVATEVVNNHNERGLEVHVTACLDQSRLRIVDRSGAPAKTDQPTRFNLRQFSVRRPAGSRSWRVYGIATATGACGR